MRVARSVSVREVRVEEVPDPVAGPGEVVCRVVACGVCGSDVQDSYVARKLPAVLGHEPVGEVVAVGEGVRSVGTGDRVVVHHHAPCGACARCARGHETLCERFRTTALDPGGFAEQVRVSADLVDELLPLPAGLDPAVATFTEPLGCVLRAQDRAHVRAGDSVLVVGAGAMGLLQIAAARRRQVAQLWVLEPRADRRELAAGWGAAPYAGAPVDVALVCTPKPPAIAAAAEALGPGGTLLLYSPMVPGEPLPFDGVEVFLRELTVTASWSAGPADMRAALALLARGEIDPAPLIQHRLPLEATGEALALQREGRTLKAVVLP